MDPNPITIIRVAGFDLDITPMLQTDGRFAAQVRVNCARTGVRRPSAEFPALEAYRTRVQALAAGYRAGLHLVRLAVQGGRDHAALG